MLEDRTLLASFIGVQVIDFDTLPDGSPTVLGSEIGDSYSSVGVTFSSFANVSGKTPTFGRSSGHADSNIAQHFARDLSEPFNIGCCLKVVLLDVILILRG